MTHTHSRRRFTLAVPVIALALAATACGSDSKSSDDTTPVGTDAATATDATTGDTAEPSDGPTIKIRGQDFSESITITEVYGQYLQAKGYDVEILGAAGFRTEAVASLENGDIDLTIDYIGGALTELVPDAEASSDADEIMATITPAFADIGATLLDYSPAVDGDALVVRGDFDGTTISDLDGADAVFGAAAHCFERPQCYIGLTDPEIYGIEFGDTVTLEFGPLLGQALAAGEVDAVFWNTTAPQITEEGFKVLEDEKGLFPAQNIAPIINTDVLAAYGDGLTTALNELSAAIDTDDLLAWNTQTDIELRESNAVATEWLEAEGLI